VIGRDVPLKPFVVIRWARAMACPPSERREYRDDPRCPDGLKPLQAHVLLILATYANDQGEAWPSIAQVARDAGRRPTKQGRHSAVSQALQDLGTWPTKVVWSTERGRGKTAMRELLLDPAQVSRYGDISAADPGPEPDRPDALVSQPRDTITTPEKASDVPASGPVMSQPREQKYQEDHLTAKTSTDRPGDDVPKLGHHDPAPVEVSEEDLSEIGGAFFRKLRAKQAQAEAEAA
jgi:hypothetical protein